MFLFWGLLQVVVEIEKIWRWGGDFVWVGLRRIPVVWVFVFSIRANSAVFFVSVVAPQSEIIHGETAFFVL